MNYPFAVPVLRQSLALGTPSATTCAFRDAEHKPCIAQRVQSRSYGRARIRTKALFPSSTNGKKRLADDAAHDRHDQNCGGIAQMNRHKMPPAAFLNSP